MLVEYVFELTTVERFNRQHQQQTTTTTIFKKSLRGLSCVFFVVLYVQDKLLSRWICFCL